MRALFVVNPSNPPSVMLAPDDAASASPQIVDDHNPDLIVVTDDVYGTFVPGFGSLMDVVPANTIAVYSFSKYFGATGWRLGVDRAPRTTTCSTGGSRRCRADEHAELDRRYESISTEPRDIRFIDRMVADSRQVALNHTAGLSLPQQVQMTLFAAFALLDGDDSYKLRTRADRRARGSRRLYEGMGVELDADPLRAGLLRRDRPPGLGPAARTAPTSPTGSAPSYDPIDPVFGLAARARHRAAARRRLRRFRVVGARVARQSRRADYLRVGTALRAVSTSYVAEWKGVDEPGPVPEVR